MTDTERAFLKSQIDQVVILETVQGERILARVLFVFDGEDTPDVFFNEVELGPNGMYVEKGSNGYSILLSEILTVQPPQA